MDEPTQGLDSQTRNRIWDYIKHLNEKEGITIFFTTHYIEEAEKVAQEVAIIDHGKIVERGTPDEIKKKANASSLEEAFLSLTGHDIREEKIDAGFDQMRRHRQMMR